MVTRFWIRGGITFPLTISAPPSIPGGLEFFTRRIRMTPMKTMTCFLLKSLLALLSWVSVSLPAWAADDEKDFKSLFTGKDLSGWRIMGGGQSGWKVTPDKLVVNSWTKGKPGSDLVSEKTFRNFTLRFDYLIRQGGNSGVYLRGRHEIQLIDDDDSRQLSAVSNGAIYNQVSPAVFASKPGGAWQTMEITILGNAITVILNGKLIHDRVPCPRPTAKPLNANMNTPGPLLLQGRLGDVKFRDMRLKELPN